MIPEVHGSKKALPLFSIQVQQKKWEGRIVEHLDATIKHLPAMLCKVSADFLNDNTVKKLRETLDTFQKSSLSVLDKIHILSSRDFTTPLLLLEKTLQSQNNSETFVQKLHLLLDCLKENEEMPFIRLNSLPHNHKIFGNVEQIPVLDQNADGTTFGFENCGYHALKNAVLMQASHGGSEAIETQFKDPALFRNFYEAFCDPLLNQQTIGKRDATLPLLWKIFDKIQSTMDLDKIALLSASSTDGTPEGKQVLGFFDDGSIKEAKKLYDFAVLSGPRNLTMVLGDETMGHWYTLLVYKNADNALFFLGCDSQDNNQNILRGNSPLYKLSQLIEEQVQNPDKLLRDAYAPLGDLLEPIANSIEPSIPNSALLDETPYLLNASDEAPSGSAKELMIAKCVHAFTFFNEVNWFKRSDYDIQLHVLHLENILSYYSENLSDKDAKRKVEQMLRFLREERPPNLIDAVFDQALAETTALKDQVPLSAYQNTINTFKNMRTVYLNRKEISQAKNDLARNDVINRLTGGGAEPGFSTGRDSEDAEKTLQRRVNLLLLTYQKTKLQGNFKEMVLRLGRGDACLTGRMAAVEDFASSLAGLEGVKDTQATKVALVPITALSAALDSLLVETDPPDEEGFVNQFKIDDFRQPEAFSILVQQFAFWCARASAQPFLEYLVNQNLTENVSSIDWESVVPKILSLPECVGWMNDAKANLIF
jgi:hypothetical protein